MSTLNTCTSSTRPASPSDGDMLYETDSYKTIIWDDTASAWREYTSSNSPYDLDGTNSVSTRPVFHFDAGKINGVDTSGNPADAGSVTTSWKSLVGDGTHDFAVQTDTSKQPTWYSSGENSKPYVYFASGDEIRFQHPTSSYGPFTMIQVMHGDNNRWSLGCSYISGFTQGANYSWLGYAGVNKRTTDFAFLYPSCTYYTGTTQSWYSTDVLDVDETRMLMLDNASSSSGLRYYCDGDNQQGGGSANTQPMRSISFVGLSAVSGNVYSASLPDGKVYEYFLWQAKDSTSTDALSTADKNSIVDYVEAKYGLSGFTQF